MHDWQLNLGAFVKQFNGVQPMDGEGNLIKIACRVATLHHEEGWVRGEEGEVRAYHGLDTVSVQFDREAGGHTCEGQLDPPCPEGHGRFVYRVNLRVIPTLPVVTSDEEAELRNVLSKVNTEGSAILFNGKIFNVAAVENTEATALFRAFTLKVAEKMKTIRAEAQSQVDKMKKELQAQLLMPTISLTNVSMGLTIYKENSYMVYAIPFDYAPLYVTEENAKGCDCEVREISEVHKKKLAHKIILLVCLDKTNRVLYVRMKSKLGGTTFNHYHGNDSQCWGTMTIPRKIASVEELYEFKTQLEKLLEIVNGGSTVNSSPPRMPDKYDLWSAARKIAKHVSDTAFVETKPKAKAQTTPAGELAVGSIVKIRPIGHRPYEAFPDVVGTIGKVVSPHKIPDCWNVEFLFRDSHFHDSANGRTGYCYYFRERELELMPLDTELSSQLAKGELTEPTTTATEERPAWRVA